jgi:Protein of unknown function (DUF3667)
MSPEQSTAVAPDVGAADVGGGSSSARAAGTAGPGAALVGGIGAANAEPLPTCANCGATVSQHYCGNCGQRLEHEIHSVWHFSREATEDLTHADSRLWSTIIALLFKPGFLTREFLAGRRVRYLPPLRLYLVLSVLFFLVLSSGGHEPRVVTLKSGSGADTPVIASRPPQDVPELAAKPGETTEQREKRVCNPDYDGPAQRFVMPFLKKGCQTIIENRGHTVSEAVMHNLPRAMFIFLPALALVMKLMYWRPKRYYVEHLLFFVHNHAFAFLLLTVLTLATRLLPSVGETLTFIVWLYVPYYVFVSMRRVYGQGRWLTFTKLTALSFAYFIGAAITLALTVTYSMFSA